MRRAFLAVLAGVAAMTLASCGANEATGSGSAFSDSLAGYSLEEYAAECTPIAFPVLDKDADNVIGQHFALQGRVTQIQDAGAGNYWDGFPGGLQPQTQMLLAVTSDEYGNWSDDVAVVHDDGLRSVYEGDLITVYGVCYGRDSYTSVAGWDMTVPFVVAEWVTKP
jgi:hypothetical protein